MNVAAEALSPVPSASLGRLLPRAVLALLALTLTLSYGYWKAFSTFRGYDDEGYLMMTVRHVLDGRALYDEVPTIYGPFYYAVRLLIHGGLGIPLTNDCVRWTTLVFWATTACLSALTVWRLTRRAAPAAVAYLLTFHHLSPLVNEPVHPQELCVLLVALMAAALPSGGGVGRAGIAAALLGAEAACLILTKVNVGFFATTGLLLAWTAASEGRPARVAFAGLMMAATLMPFLLMRHDLDTASNHAVVVALSLLAFAIVGSAADRPLGAPPARLLAYAAGGAALAAMIPVIAVCTGGTTLSGLLEGILRRPWQFTSLGSYGIRGIGTREGVLAAGISAALAMTYFKCSARPVPGPSLDRAVVLMKGVFGAFGLTCALLSRSDLLLNFATPFVWLILARPRGEDGRSTLPRLTLGFLAPLQGLQAYPVGVSQMYVGTFLLVAIAAVCAVDALASIEGSLALRLLPHQLARAALPVAAVPLLWMAVGMAGRERRVYEGQMPVARFAGDGPGLLRIDEKQAATYQWLVSNLRQYADTFESNTGMNSLHFWSGIGPPTALVVGHALDLFSDQEQEKIVAALRQAPKACVIESPAHWPPRRPSPLLEEIQRAFETQGVVGAFRFGVRKGREIPFMVDCAVWSEGQGGVSGAAATASIVVTPLPGKRTHGLCIYNVDQGKVVAGTGHGEGTPPLTIRGDGAPVALPLDFPDSEGAGMPPPRKLTLTLPVVGPGLREGFLVVRLLDAEGAVLRSLPFLSRP